MKGSEILYRDTVTLFNRYRENGKCLWLPTVLHGVGLSGTFSAASGRYGVRTDDKIVLHVRVSVSEDGVKTVGGKLLLPPAAWRGQSRTAAENSVTFCCGTEFDFFVCGKTDINADGVGISDVAVGVVDDGDYMRDGGFYGHIDRTYGNAYAITSVSGPFSLIPHIEITGR